MMKGDRQLAIGDRKKIIFYLLVLSAYCLLLTGISESAEKENLMSDINRMILRELKNSVSEDVEITGLRVLEGMDALENLEGYKINAVAMNGYAGRNKVNFMVDLRDKKRMSRKNIIVEASYDVLVDVFISSRPLTKGTVLTADDFYAVKQKSSKLPVGAVLGRNDVEKKILKNNIGQGVIIRADYLTNQLSIKRGQRVDVVVEGDNVAISTHGILKNDTVVGGTAKVLCDVSKKEVIGVLISPNTVRVKI
ncbi:MAG: flagellar basal body P-ring formation chaperone FlgA [Thermodesulfovibrionales bacterium]|jgi:flagella basal body P-ring formation protein FlgA|nr:flagellar basal body P-ring formation chaperone FlgA [Thermodesulfovibrionales bacterium]